MGIEVRYRGRVYGEREIEEVRQIISRNPGQSRYFLSKELCRCWNWTQPNGTLKDMVCRGLMLELEREGLIVLPGQKRELPWLSRKRAHPSKPKLDDSLVAVSLSGLSLDFSMVRRTARERLYQGLVQPLPLPGLYPAGRRTPGILYIVFWQGRPLACLGWSSAPRHIGVRDRYLGWNRQQRLANLHKIAVNTRFLILPFVHVPHLASHLLGRMARRISGDWERVYHHPVVWLETFIDPQKGFKGTCYKAANWRYLGLTTGRGKNDNSGKPNRSLKYVFGYPLLTDFRKALYGVL
ncbi:MAG: Druantia anti-phage system protein DruA [Acidobacteriota bacterium]